MRRVRDLLLPGATNRSLLTELLIAVRMMFFLQIGHASGAFDCGKRMFRSFDSVREKAIWEKKYVIYDYNRQMGRWVIFLRRDRLFPAVFKSAMW